MKPKMNALVRYLVESILLEEEGTKPVIVYSGRFQPFHKGHFVTYQHLVKKFGKENVFIATSNSTNTTNSPFDFKEKRLIMMKMFGIPSAKIVNTKAPYAPSEILKNFSESTPYISAVGEKDSTRLLAGKYFEKWTPSIKMKGYKEKGYFYITPTQENPISGTDVRQWCSTGNEKQKKKGFENAYGKFDEKIYKLVTLKLAKMCKLNENTTIVLGPVGSFATTGNEHNFDWDDYWEQDYYLLDLPGWDKVHSDVEDEIDPAIVKRVLPLFNHGDEAGEQHKDSLKKKMKPLTNYIMGDGPQPVGGSTIAEGRIITEGGAYGHLSHPFETQMGITFGDLKAIIKKALTGKLEMTTVKTDGQALAVSWVDGKLVAARNKSHLKNSGKDAMDMGALASKFAGRGEITEAFTFAMKDLSAAISGLSEKDKKSIFKNGKCFMNCEIIYPATTNVIPYGQSLLIFHGTMEYDIEGNAIGENRQAGAKLAAMVKKINADVQEKFELQGPPIVKLPTNKDLTSKQTKYLQMVTELQNEFGLSASDGVDEYHQAWWSRYIAEKCPSKLSDSEKVGLIKRWAFDDTSFRLKDITDPTTRNWALSIDKADKEKIAKENLMKFERIFLGVGAEILLFTEALLVANPDEAKRQLGQQLQSAISQIRATGDGKAIEKLELELKRLEDAGGAEKIVPIEGIVFTYKGHTMKLTGIFASLNQILGIMKYKR